MKSLIFPAVLVAVSVTILALILLFGSAKDESFKPDNPGSLVSLNTGNYPWPTETGSLKDRLNASGLPALKSEGSVLHTHQHLDIFVGGKAVPVPAEIGVNGAVGFISPVHTHDATGIIHVESPVVQAFTLGQFFNVWGVRFNDDCLGGYCSAGDRKLRVFVNGDEVKSGFAGVFLEPYQEIVVAYGLNEQTPNPIPKSFKFPPDY